MGTSWNVVEKFSNESGSLLALILVNGLNLLAVASVYLPPGLDKVGEETKSSTQASILKTTRDEAVSTYDDIRLCWIISGDFNETRTKLDRKGPTKSYAYSNSRVKFIDNLLKAIDGLDVWRYLHPLGPPGFTRVHSKASAARLDYFLLDRIWLETMRHSLQIMIGNDNQSDHFFISITFTMKPMIANPTPFTIRRPKICSNGTAEVVAQTSFLLWEKFYGNNDWSFQSMEYFSDSIRMTAGDLNGWRGGNIFIRRDKKECRLRSNFNKLCDLAAWIRRSYEQERRENPGQVKAVINYKLFDLQNNGVVPKTVGVNSLEQWMNDTLNLTLAQLKLRIMRQGDILQISGTRKSSFPNSF